MYKIEKAMDVKLNVRPVFVGFQHLYFFEGPCRFGVGDQLQPEFDTLMNQESYQAFITEVQDNVPQDIIHIMDPIYVETTDEWIYKNEIFETMMQDNEHVDLYLLAVGIGGLEVIPEFAMRCKKPLAVRPTECCMNPGLAPGIRSRGGEYYATRTWKDLETVLRALRIRKVLRCTTVLTATRFDTNAKFNSDVFNSFELVREKLGVNFRSYNVHELMDQLQLYPEGGNHTTPGRMTPNLTQEDITEASRLADEMIAGAKEVVIDKSYLEKSIQAYLVVKKIMEQRGCNAFTVPCPDLCSTRRINEQKVTFCLTHSLMMEEGIPSACDSDVNALISMAVLIALSKKAPFMGNTNVMPIVDGKIDTMAHFDMRSLEDVKDLNNLYNSAHSTPSRKFKGLDKENSDYSIRYFAHEQKFGAVLRYDFKQDIGQEITLLRFSPDVKKMLVGKATIVSGGGYDLNNCNGVVVFRVEDQKKFFDAQCEVGLHLPFVYGDYTEELCELGKMLDIDVLRV